MFGILRLIWDAITGFFRPQLDREAEIVALRHQLGVLRRKGPEGLVFNNTDRLLLVWLYRLFPGVLNALLIVEPATVIGWHRREFRWFWHWKSMSRAGRPKTPLEMRPTIRDISAANPLWGAGRIHGNATTGMVMKECPPSLGRRPAPPAHVLGDRRLAEPAEALVSRHVQINGRIRPVPLLGGLHHQYVRI